MSGLSLVERLRLACDPANHRFRHDRDALLRRAADEIERLTAQGIEAATAGETVGLDGNRESPVAKPCAQTPPTPKESSS